MGGTWLTYLLLIMLVVTVVLAWFWIIDYVFDEIKAVLQRRYERRALERWKRIQELEEELGEGPV